MESVLSPLLISYLYQLRSYFLSSSFPFTTSILWRAFYHHFSFLISTNSDPIFSHHLFLSQHLYYGERFITTSHFLSLPTQILFSLIIFSFHNIYIMESVLSGRKVSESSKLDGINYTLWSFKLGTTLRGERVW
jgi:hypothetical protein